MLQKKNKKQREHSVFCGERNSWTVIFFTLLFLLEFPDTERTFSFSYDLGNRKMVKQKRIFKSVWCVARSVDK